MALSPEEFGDLLARKTASSTPDVAASARDVPMTSLGSRSTSSLFGKTASPGMTADAPGGGFSLGGAFWTALKTIDKPRAAIVSTVKETTDLVQGEGFSFNDWTEQVGRNIGFNEVLDDIGVENVWVRRVAGFVGDVAVDPLTYMGGIGLVNRAKGGSQLTRKMARITANVSDPALKRSMTAVTAKLGQRGGTSVTRTEAAMIQAAVLADDAATAARAAGTAGPGYGREFMDLARKASTTGLSRGEYRYLEKLAPSAVKSGTRLVVPGTGRLAKTVRKGAVKKSQAAGLGGDIEKSVRILPQGASKWTPRGLYQHARVGSAGTVAGKAVRAQLGGDFTKVKTMLLSQDPERVLDGLHMMDATSQGRSSGLAVGSELEHATNKVKNLVEEENKHLIMPALLGDATAQAALQEKGKLEHVWAFKEEWRYAANKAADTPEGDLLGNLETWAPTELSADAKALFEMWNEGPEWVALQAKGLNPLATEGKIKAGVKFMGEDLVNQADHKRNLTVRAQAEEIFGDWLAETGNGPFVKLFDDDFDVAVSVSQHFTQARVAQQKAISVLHSRGVAVDITTNLGDLTAQGRARSTRGRLTVEGVKRGHLRDQAVVDEATEAIRAIEAQKAGRQVTAKSAKLAAKTTKGWAESAKGVAIEAQKALELAEDANEKVAKVLRGDNIAATEKEIVEAGRAVRALEAKNSEILGEIDRMRQKLDILHRKAEAARELAESSAENAKRVGPKLLVANKEIDKLTKQLTTAEEGLEAWAAIPNNHFQDVKELGEKLDAAYLEREKLMSVIPDERMRQMRARGTKADLHSTGNADHRIDADLAAKALKIEGVGDVAGAEARLLRLNKSIAIGEEYRVSLDEITDIIPVEPFDGMEAITRRRYRDQVRSVRGILKRRVAGKQKLVATLGSEQEEVLAALATPPRPLANGRVGHRLGSLWVPGAHKAIPTARGGADTSSPTRFLGEVYSEAGAEAAAAQPLGGWATPNLQGYPLMIENPAVYVGGEPAMWMDALEDMFKTVGARNNAVVSLGPMWGKVAAAVRNGTPMEKAIRKTFSAQFDPTDHVADLISGHSWKTPVDTTMAPLGGIRMGTEGKRVMMKAFRKSLLGRPGGGADAVTYLDDTGKWHMIPFDKNAVEGLSTEWPDDTFASLVEMQREQTRMLSVGVDAKEELAREMGADLDMLNGQHQQSTRLAQEQKGDVQRRYDQLKEDVAQGKFDTTSANAVEELEELTRANNALSDLERIRAATQGKLDDLTSKIPAEDLAADALIVELQAQASVAAANMARRRQRVASKVKSTQARQSKGKKGEKLELAGEEGSWEQLEDLIGKIGKVDETLFEDTLKSGWVRIGHKEGQQIPPHIAEGLASHSKILGNRDGLMKHFDVATQVWKAQATLSPGFHSRNFLGGMINNFSAGIDHGRYRQFKKMDDIFKGALKENLSVEQALAKVRTEGGELGEVYAKIQGTGLLSGGQFDELAYIAGGGGGGLNKINPFSRTNMAVQFSQRKGLQVEQYLRGSLAMDVIAKGGTADDAISQVHKFHFDYEDLSSFERTVARRLIPFYTWSRKNLPLQLEMMVENPATFTRYLSVKRNLEVGTEEEALFPHYLQRLNAIRAPFMVGGDQLYLSPSLPFSDLTQMTSFSGLMSATNPLVRAPLESGVPGTSFGGLDKSFFTGAPFGERHEALPASWAPLGGALEAIGEASRDARGQLQVKSSTSTFLNSMSPLMGQLWRMDPAGLVDRGLGGDSVSPRPDNRMAASIASYMFGLGGRVNTSHDQANELFRIAHTYDAKIRKGTQLGHDVDQLRIDQQEYFDKGRQLKDEA